MSGHRQGADATRALVVAHRGAWGEAPQNSLAAFERAIELGCDAVELDVRLTADGALAIVHDARVGGRAVANQTLAELRSRPGHRETPVLEAVVELAAGRIALDVELKRSDCARAAVGLLAARLAPAACVVTSFDDDALRLARRAWPEVRTGLLVGPRLRARELEGRLRRTGAALIAPHVGLARPRLLRWAAERELPVWVWTVNDPRALRRLGRDSRVQAQITDRPERAIEAIRETP
ncbi:MAG: glycerophosphodiester phosphodiesterase [Solirubrobacteraceae bacterium]